MKLYTKGGDKGSTSLIGGARVSKNDSRVEAYGTVDELSAFVALLSDKLRGEECDYSAELDSINSMLMSVEALLACDENSAKTMPTISDENISALEQKIDDLQAQLEPLTKFTIPGGDERVSMCHVCRTVCRRAERRAIAAAEEWEVSANAVIYLNRLSDYFYALGRVLTLRLGVEEILWRG
ncbi:MAG: cob(I)yrinic acid a,c-diamide adenosyltransferase [Rikenellaceae bacterium]